MKPISEKYYPDSETLIEVKTTPRTSISSFISRANFSKEEESSKILIDTKEPLEFQADVSNSDESLHDLNTSLIIPSTDKGMKNIISLMGGVLNGKNTNSMNARKRFDQAHMRQSSGLSFMSRGMPGSFIHVNDDYSDCIPRKLEGTQKKSSSPAEELVRNKNYYYLLSFLS